MGPVTQMWINSNALNLITHLDGNIYCTETKTCSISYSATSTMEHTGDEALNVTVQDTDSILILLRPKALFFSSTQP